MKIPPRDPNATAAQEAERLRSIHTPTNQASEDESRNEVSTDQEVPGQDVAGL